MNIKLYTIGCPKCTVLEKKLDAARIKYEKHEDTEEMISLGLQSAPVLDVNGQILTFVDAVKWINSEAYKDAN